MVDFPKISFNLPGILSSPKTAPLEGRGVDPQKTKSPLPDSVDGFTNIVEDMFVKSSGVIDFAKHVNDGAQFTLADSKSFTSDTRTKEALDLLMKLLA